jgi:hypothetical protein
MQLDYLTGGARDTVVGQWLSRGVQSQPILLQLDHGNALLFNQNPDAAYTPSGPRPNATGTPLTTSVSNSLSTSPITASQSTPRAITVTNASSDREARSGPVRTGRIAWRELLRTE